MAEAEMTGHVCPPDHKHALNGTCRTHHGCQCFPCKRRAAAYQAHFRANRTGGTLLVSSRGMRRRVEALMTLGYPIRRIEIEAGLHRDWIRRQTTQDMIRRKAHNRIARVYERLSMTPNTSDTKQGKALISRVKRLARKNGYIPPIAWNDIDRDEAPEFRTDAAIVAEFQARTAAGETTRDLRGLVVELVENGHSQSEAGRLLGLSPRAVSRVINIETKEAA